ncbi:LamG domain-containing protein [Arthrobacter mangrovi]|uniref:LamG domain-containing protein n=1 Tax=Arthrobacter mangrovi TaxID=2966350 RepID=A0ABQ5MV89_9MICC|nr:LamG domain-containing protein [Arthrobacter mangrovi]GLB67868.1 hypothetical protein AHIS1636_23080 [Arthrobacter mangrovi]
MTRRQGSTQSSLLKGTKPILLSALALGLLGIPTTAPAEGFQNERAAEPTATYDSAVLADKPSAYWTMGSPFRSTEKDRTGRGHTGTYFGRPSAAKLPNGDTAADFDGGREYLQVADSAALSPATRGLLTLEAWMRPDTVTFPGEGGSSHYVHWMGKGEPGNHEYVARFYSKDDPDRPNRISGYLFNSSGGKGAGAYFQEKVSAGKWIHYVFVINANAKSDTYPNGYSKIYRDGVLKKTVDLSYRGSAVVPTKGNAPLRVATRDGGSFFNGAIGKVAVYTKELSGKRIAAHYDAMTRK